MFSFVLQCKADWSHWVALAKEDTFQLSVQHKRKNIVVLAALKGI